MTQRWWDQGGIDLDLDLYLEGVREGARATDVGMKAGAETEVEERRGEAE